VLTGERGDRILLDGRHNVVKAESDAESEKTVRFVRESCWRGRTGFSRRGSVSPHC
jgi:hypothetical protein